MPQPDSKVLQHHPSQAVLRPTGRISNPRGEGAGPVFAMGNVGDRPGRNLCEGALQKIKKK